MRVGLQVGMRRDVESAVSSIVRAEECGLASVWVPSVTSRLDALGVLTLAAIRTNRIELGTGVVPTFPRHPVALAQQALTVQAISGDRVALGIGLSHRRTMEGMLGFDWSRPIKHTRAYLQALRALLSGEVVNLENSEYRIQGFQMAVPGVRKPPPVLVAALGPQMLRLAGELADGTNLWMGGTRYIGEIVAPTIHAAARAAGRPESAVRIVAGVPVCVTSHADARRERASKEFGHYGTVPSYRAVLEMNGTPEPADVCLIGDERTVHEGMRAFEAAGTTDFFAAPFGDGPVEIAETFAALASYR